MIDKQRSQEGEFLAEAVIDYYKNCPLEHRPDFAKGYGSIWDLVVDTLGKYVKHLIDKGDILTFEQHQYYKNEHIAEVNTEALSCAVADVELEHDRLTALQDQEIASLKKTIAQYEKIINHFTDPDGDTVVAENKKLRQSLEDIKSEMDKLNKEANDGLKRLNEEASKRPDANANGMYDIEDSYYRDIARYAWAYRATQIVGYHISPIVDKALK